MRIWPFSVINALRVKLDATLLNTAELKHRHAGEVIVLREHGRRQAALARTDAELLRQEVTLLEQQIAEGRDAAGGMYILGGVSAVETAEEFYHDVGREVVRSGGVTVFPNYTTLGAVAYRLNLQQPTGRRYQNTTEQAMKIAAASRQPVKR